MTSRPRLYPGNPEGYEKLFEPYAKWRIRMAMGGIPQGERYWTTSDRYVIRIKDMCDSHLEAAIKDMQAQGRPRSLDILINELFRRRAERALTSEGNNAVSQD